MSLSSAPNIFRLSESMSFSDVNKAVRCPFCLGIWILFEVGHVPYRMIQDLLLIIFLNQYGLYP